MRSIYLAHPWRGQPHRFPRVMAWYIWAQTEVGPEVHVEAGWILSALVYDRPGVDIQQRLAGLRRCSHVLAGCHEIWLVGGSITDGMRYEVNVAHELGVRIWDRSDMGIYPPGWDEEKAVAAVQRVVGVAS